MIDKKFSDWNKLLYIIFQSGRNRVDAIHSLGNISDMSLLYFTGP